MRVATARIMNKIIYVLFLLFFCCDKKVPEAVNFFDQYDSIINSNSMNTGITSNLIKGIMYCESYMVYNTNRYEPQLKTNIRYVMSIPEEHRSNNLSYTSLGLMQLLPGTAYWLGYTGPPEGLYDPEINIYYGTKFLLILIRLYRYQKPVISAYNGGHPLINSNGTYRNNVYISNVVRKYRQYKKNAEILEWINRQ